jgi:peptidoglycan-associated lipoprotein
MNVRANRWRVSLLGAAGLVMIPLVTPALALSPCGASRGGGLAQLPGNRPLADPLPHIPINGTAGFVVPGANTLPGGDLSIGLGYLGQEAVCQQEDGIFDQNSLFLALGYGLTERLQLSFQAPYTWYEADKSDFSGDGPDDLSFGLGYRFLDEAGWRPALSLVGYGVAPTAERTEGLGTNEWSAGAALAASKKIVGPLSGFASAGYQYNGRGGAQVDDQFVSGVGVEYAFTPHISALAEGIANTNWRKEEDRHSDWIAGMNAGVRLRYGGFLVSLAGTKGFTNDAPDWGAFALVTYQVQVGTPLRRAAAPDAGPGVAAPAAAAPVAPGAPGAAPPPAAPVAPTAPGAPPAAAAPGAPAAPEAVAPGAPVAPGAAAPAAPPAAPGVPAAPAAPPAAPGVPAAPAAPPAAAAPGVPAAPAAPAAPGAPGAPGVAPAPGAVAAVPPAALPPSLRSAIQDINFEFDQYALTDEAKAALSELAQALKANPQFAVTIEGHADERGTVEYNLALGEQRARAAKDYLVSQGVDASRVDTISYGEQRPVDPGHDELAWAINRRIHFLVRGR